MSDELNQHYVLNNENLHHQSNIELVRSKYGANTAQNQRLEMELYS